MGETLYPISTGFYNSFNKDRPYGSLDVSMPYSALLGKGIFRGGFACSLSDGVLTVSPGMAWLNGHWFLVEQAQTINVPAVESVTQIDGIFIRVDVNLEHRTGYLVLREGTIDSQVPPSIDTSEEVEELMLGYIDGNGDFVDLRGDDEKCPYLKFQYRKYYVAGEGITIVDGVISTKADPGPDPGRMLATETDIPIITEDGINIIN